MRKLLASLFIGSIAIFAWAQQPRTTLRADVVVVGSGIAGMVSALSASEMNASVIILEKMPIIGGNTRLSTGLFNAPDPARQKPQNIEDSVEWFYKQTFEAGHSIAKPRLVRRMVENAYPSMKWLESYGIAYKQEVIQLYGGLWPRTHNPSISHGRAYIALLSKACETRNIPIMTEMKVEELLRQKNGDKRVYGVMARGKTGTVRVLANKAVILATGGFTANKKMCEDLNPALKGLPYTGAASATGEMLEIASRIGANLRDMKEIQINLGSQLGHKFRNGYHIDIAHHLLVNLNGERFVNEDGTRDKLGNAILRQPKKTVFSVIDYNGFQHMNSLFQQASAMSERRGTVYEGRTIAELATKVGVDPKRFVATVDIYNKAVDTKKDSWGREPHMLVHKIDTPPFYAAKVIPAIHYTMGGIEIDEDARVIDKQGRPIDGLFAAGEVTGGVHGANRIGGNAILDAVVFGRIAGRVAMGSNL